MSEKDDKVKPEQKSDLEPTIGNLDKIQDSFDKARKEIDRQKNINKEDYRSV